MTQGSEEGGMVFFQGGEDFGHDGLAEEGAAGLHAKTGTVLVNGGHFAVVEKQYVPVVPQEHLPLLLKVGRIYAGYFFLTSHHQSFT